MNAGLSIAEKIIDKKKQVLFSPLSSAYTLASGNESFVLANPGLRTHCTQLASYINTKYAGARKVILIYRRHSADSINASYFKSQLKLRGIELTEKSDSSYWNAEDFLSVLDPNLIIIPSFDEEFVNTMTKKFFELTANFKITLFGMPTWTEMETVRLDYLQALNTHITSSFFVDDSLKNFMQFREDYKMKFSSRPDEYSYKSYSLVLFIGNLWKEHGDKWMDYIHFPQKELGVDFNFAPVILNENTSPDFIENKSVYVLTYRKNKLIRVK